MTSHPSDHGLDALGALQDPVRRALYRYVVTQRREVGRNEAASAVGVQRTLAAFHLDKLVDAGLLEASFRRLTDRSGPGAGRPAKVYRRGPADHAVSLPPRSYPVAAELLAEVVDELGGDAALHATARRAGREMGVRAGGSPEPALEGRITAVLVENGFEPYVDGDVIRLHNCPFHQLSRQFPPLICGMNLALLEGIVEGVGGGGSLAARLDPAPGRCCVAVAPIEGSEHRSSSSKTYEH